MAGWSGLEGVSLGIPGKSLPLHVTVTHVCTSAGHWIQALHMPVGQSQPSLRVHWPKNPEAWAENLYLQERTLEVGLRKKTLLLSPGKNTDDWAKNLKEEDFELLCTDGTRKSVSQAETCHLARAPNHGVVAREDKAACVRQMLLNQQVWTSQGLPCFLSVWIICGEFTAKCSPAFFFWKLELREYGLWNWVSQAWLCLYLLVTGG